MPITETARSTARAVRPSPWLLAVGLWQIAGGAVALVSWLTIVLRMRRDSVGLDLIVIGGIVFALFALAAGYGLVRQRRGAVLASLCVQALQMIGVSAGAVVYQLALGPYLDLTIQGLHRVAVIAGFQTRLTLTVVRHAPGQTGIAINLLACVILWILLRYDAGDVARDRSHPLTPAKSEIAP